MFECRPLRAGGIDGKSYRYFCDKESVILEEINTNNPVWAATVGYLTKDFRKLLKEEKLKIVKVWE